MPLNPDGSSLDPRGLGDRYPLHQLLFYYPGLNQKILDLAKGLKKAEKEKLYIYLSTHVDHFDAGSKQFHFQPLRISAIQFPDAHLVHVGMDSYGSHFHEDRPIEQLESGKGRTIMGVLMMGERNDNHCGD